MRDYVRYVLYTFVICVLSVSLTPILEWQGIDVVRENGPFEWLQWGLIATLTALLLGAAWQIAAYRELFILIGSVGALAASRELDAILDAWIPGLGWKIGFVAPILAWVYLRHRKAELKQQIAQFITTRAFAIIWTGFILTYPIAQLVGHAPLLREVMGPDYQFGYKQMIEEILELMGYTLLLMGAIESLIQAPQKPALGATAIARTPTTPPRVVHQLTFFSAPVDARSDLCNSPHLRIARQPDGGAAGTAIRSGRNHARLSSRTNNLEQR
jgi:hypothetical protein